MLAPRVRAKVTAKSVTVNFLCYLTSRCAGNLWVALGESGCVVQYDPGTGKELQVLAPHLVNFFRALVVTHHVCVDV